MQRDVVFELAEHIVNTNYQAMPPEAVAVTRKCLLDTLGVIMAATTAPGCEALYGLAEEWGGREESTVIGRGRKLPAPNAVMVNATMARARDFDGVHEAAHDHPSVATVPAALAMAEKLGGMHGRDFLAAIALGDDLVLRLRLACRAKSGVRHSPWTSGTYAPFGAAAVAGKMLRLDEEKMVNALGLAFTEASNTLQSRMDGSLAVRVHQGMAAKAGVVAALLAERGITGPHNALEGKLGLFQAYEGGVYDRPTLLADLGRRFEGANISIKPYPCCKFTHAAIDATLRIAADHDLEADQVEDVIVYVSQDCFISVCDPLGRKQRPGSIVDAQFSIPYTVATAIVRRGVYLDDFTEAAIRDSLTLEMARKVRPMVDPELGETGMGPSIVKIRTVDKLTYSERVDCVRGHYLRTGSGILPWIIRPNDRGTTGIARGEPDGLH
ncbi:MAG: MmgE/PrpD family protein [Chloroflexi bacterium]|nr:MmgE/PrpD family protein [Chloroflexota bacterium]